MERRLLLLVPTTTYRARAFIEAARRLPVALSVASEEPSALQHIAPASLPAFDFADVDESVRAAQTLHDDSPVHAVVAVDDGATRAAAAIAARLGLQGNSLESVECCLDKCRMRQRFDRTGVHQPPWTICSFGEPAALPGPMTYPVVVKPRAMSGSRGVIRADNDRELTAAIRRVERIELGAAVSSTGALVEGFVPGDEIAIEGLLHDGALHVITVFDKPDPLNGPFFPETIYTTPSRLPEPFRARAFARLREVIAALDVRDGPIHAELRGSAERVELIEIATRSIGGLCSRVLQFAGGVTLEDVILRHALGLLEAPPALTNPAAGVYMLQVPAAGRVERIDGVERAARVPGIDEIRITANPGREITPLPDGSIYPGFLFARRPTADAVEQALREAASCIRFTMANS